MGVVYVAFAKMKYAAFESAEAKKYIYQCLELYLTTSNRDRIGRAYINVAHAECRDLNYKKAREMLEIGKEYWENDKVRLHGLKELIKTQLKLKEFQATETLIRLTLKSESFEQSRDVQARLYILLSKATRDPQYAQSVAVNLSYPKAVRYLAYRYLTQVYKQERCRRYGTGSQGKSKGRVPVKRFPIDKNF